MTNKIKEEEKPDSFPCDHDTELMVDLLAAEISEKDRITLSEQLDNCKVCRDELATLSHTWNLTTEILKSDNEFQVPSTEFPVEDTEKEENKAEKKPAEKKVKTSDKDPKKNFTFVFKEKVNSVLKKQKQFKFAWGEIAASVVVAFIALMIFSINKFGSKDSAMLSRSDRRYDNEEATLSVSSDDYIMDPSSGPTETGSSYEYSNAKRPQRKDTRGKGGVVDNKGEGEGSGWSLSNLFGGNKSKEDSKTAEKAEQLAPPATESAPAEDVDFEPADIAVDEAEIQSATEVQFFAKTAKGRKKAVKSFGGTAPPAKPTKGLNSSGERESKSKDSLGLVGNDMGGATYTATTPKPKASRYRGAEKRQDIGGISGKRLESNTRRDLPTVNGAIPDSAKLPGGGRANTNEGGKLPLEKNADKSISIDYSDGDSLQKTQSTVTVSPENAPKLKNWHAPVNAEKEVTSTFSGEEKRRAVKVTKYKKKKANLNEMKKLEAPLLKEEAEEELLDDAGGEAEWKFEASGLKKQEESLKKVAEKADTTTVSGYIVTHDGKKVVADNIKIDGNGVLSIKNGRTTSKLKPADYRHAKLSDGTVIREKDKQLMSLQTKMIPFNKELYRWMGGSDKELKKYFKERGVTFINGSNLANNPNGKSLVVCDTPENLKKIEEIINTTRNTLEELHDMENGLPFINTEQKPFSTFSIDVDTASYTRTAKEIREGRRPSSHSVRPEEFVNFFDYHYRSPVRRMFGVYLEAAPCPYRPMNTTLRIGVQGKRLGSALNRPSAFTILIDTSGSMANKNRLDLVKRSLPIMLSKLRDTDKVSVVACGSETNIIVPMTLVRNKKQIMRAVKNIEPKGVTDLEKGIVKAYTSAEKSYVAGAYNRVILFTDGISNISTASAEEVLEEVETARKMGISNTIVSVGGDGDDTFLETLADKGDGSYVFIEDDESAKDLFENQFAARFREIARDVKIQVEFNKALVGKYRQVGYQNRQLSKADFRNDTVDAGEVGAGQSVTALYEMQINNNIIIPMQKRSHSTIFPPTPVATVRIRYKRADNMQVEEFEYPLYPSDIMKRNHKTSPNFKLACAVAEFAENLRFPDTPGIASLNVVRKKLRPLLAGTYKNDSKVKELDDLVRLAK